MQQAKAKGKEEAMLSCTGKEGSGWDKGEIKRKKWPEDNLAMSGSTAGEDRMQKR